MFPMAQSFLPNLPEGSYNACLGIPSEWIILVSYSFFCLSGLSGFISGLCTSRRISESFLDRFADPFVTFCLLLAAAQGFAAFGLLFGKNALFVILTGFPFIFAIFVLFAVNIGSFVVPFYCGSYLRKGLVFICCSLNLRSS